MFKKIIKYLAKTYIDQAYLKGIRDEKITRQKDHVDCDVFSIQEDIGKSVIYCSNEWEDPDFIVITGITYVTAAKQPMAVGTNVLTSEEAWLHPRSYYYADKEMLDCILKLNPFERWNMSAKNQGCNLWNKWYPKGEITDPNILKQKLLDVDFV